MVVRVGKFWVVDYLSTELFIIFGMVKVFYLVYLLAVLLNFYFEKVMLLVEYGLII
jgi:hypothetical protein